MAGDIAAVLQGKPCDDQGPPDNLEATTAFPYLIRKFTYNNSDWAWLYSNLLKYQRIWGMVTKVIG